MTNQYKFKVEVINIISGQGGLVKVRVLENEDYFVPPVLKLNGVIIKGGDIPRMLGENGMLRTDIGGGCLENESDVSTFKIGDVVEL
ncbi:MAG: hypothetical protein JKX98_10555 [Alcanivoracaceae bacterium]|nr:hypothetical protein [Alcanivoracaceae bacterium]